MTVGPAVALTVALLTLVCLSVVVPAVRRRRAPPPPAAGRPTWSPRAHRLPIERIAADLRRLNRHRLGVASRSAMWHSAVLEAYDDRLRMASRCLEVAEYLDELDGTDRAIERVRVEGELQAAGLHLRAAPTHPQRRPP